MILLSNRDVRANLQNAPGTFAGLMDLYECNYIGVRRLIRHMPAASSCRISQVPGGLDLHLEVLERFRYTTELTLTYHFLRDMGSVAEPDLRIRVYHDARLAEVLSAHLRNWPIETCSTNPKAQLLSRWHINRFLYKWLNFCLRQGHRFDETVKY